MKLRLRSTKLGKVRFTSHRDAARMWERALRRIDLPVASTEGFHPRPKISFGLALPTGAESIAEYTDIELQREVSCDDIDLDTLDDRLSAALPRGFEVVQVVEWSHKGSLQQDVTSCTWELWSPHLTADSYQGALELLEAPHLEFERERKGKLRTDDVRPLIIDIRVGDNGESAPYTQLPVGERLLVDLVTVGSALRPAEFATLAFPDFDSRDIRALRTHQWIDDGSARSEVLHTARRATSTSSDEVLV